MVILVSNFKHLSLTSYIICTPSLQKSCRGRWDFHVSLSQTSPRLSPQNQNPADQKQQEQGNPTAAFTRFTVLDPGGVYGESDAFTLTPRLDNSVLGFRCFSVPRRSQQRFSAGDSVLGGELSSTIVMAAILKRSK